MAKKFWNIEKESKGSLDWDRDSLRWWFNITFMKHSIQIWKPSK